MSSFWEATSKIPVEQTTVRLASTNGLTYSAGQEIRLTIPQDITYFNPSGTYLEGKVRIKAPTYSDATGETAIKPCRLQLDAQTGVSSLIRNITLRSGNWVLLEEIDHYNSWVALKTDYSTNESLKGRRALTDGSTDYKIDSRGTQGTTKSIQNDISTNPYFKPATATSVDGSASFDATDFVEATFAIPLHTGILSNTKLFPNGMVGQNGLQITCLLEQNNVAFRQLEGNSLYRKTRLNPIFHGRNENGASMSSASAGTYTTIFLREQNSQNLEAKKCAFVVGQRIGFFNASTGLEATYSDGGPEIASITYDADDYLVLNLKSAINNNENINTTLGEWFIYDRSTLTASTYDPTYEISDVNIVIQKVTPPAQYEKEMLAKMACGGNICYDFDTVSTYLYSQLATDRVANIRLPIENERCKSILCMPCDATPYTTQNVINASLGYKIEVEEKANVNWYLRSDRPNLVGIVDEATTYQWYYDNRLQPAREVSLTKLATKKSISAVHLIQLDDALSAAGITAHSLKSFRDNFVVGRALGLNNMTYDARNKDFNLQINYQGTTAPTKSKLWKSYVVSIRRLEISSNGVRVII